MKKEDLLSSRIAQVGLVNGKFVLFAYSLNIVNDMQVRINDQDQSILLTPDVALLLLDWLQKEKEHLELLRDGEL
jgi:hypothetical protein